MHARMSGSGSSRAVLAGAVFLLAACGGSGSGGGLGEVAAPVAAATLGAVCDIGNPINALSVLAVNPEAHECASNPCLFPARERYTETAPLCTVTCSSDADCATGQRASGPGDRRCQRGFVCRTLLPKLENNPLSCQALCVCSDFLSVNEPHARPPSCP